MSEIFELVDKAKTKQEKVNILKKYETPALRGYLKMNFHNEVDLGLPEGEPPYKKQPDRPIGEHESKLLSEYRRFYIWLDPKTQLPKVKKETLFIEMLEALHISEAEDMVLIKDKKLQKKYKTLKEDIVREAFPQILPPKETS